MSIDSRDSTSPGSQESVRATRTARAAMIARVQNQLTARAKLVDRRCPLCGEPIRGGQACTTVHGTAVHARCRRASRTVL
jgi:hypothetical protein